MAKAAVNTQKAVFTSKLESDLSKEPSKFNVWSITLCGNETWINRKIVDQYLGNFEEGWI